MKTKLSKNQMKIVKLMRKGWLLCEDIIDDVRYSKYHLREKYATNYSNHKIIHSATFHSLIRKNVVVLSKSKSTTSTGKGGYGITAIIVYVLSKEYLK